MISAQQQATLRGAGCEIAFDNLTLQLYATDASIYQIEPLAVAFPANTRQLSALIDTAVQADVAVIPRGAGTGLVGGAIGQGLVVDFSRYNRQITDLDLERRTVRVGPGVVLDHLNSFLFILRKPHAAQAEPGYLKPRFPICSIFHIAHLPSLSYRPHHTWNNLEYKL